MDSIQHDEVRTKSSVTNVLKTRRCEKQRIANYFSTMVCNARSIAAKCSIGGKSLLGCKIQKFRSDEKQLTKHEIHGNSDLQSRSFKRTMDKIPSRYKVQSHQN